MLENIWSQSWCLYEKYHFLYPKFSISPSRCSMAQVKPYIGLIYMKNATFSYHQCLWNVRGSSFVSGGHSLGPKCGGAVVTALALRQEGCGFNPARCCVLAIRRLSPPPRWMGSQTAVKPHPERVCWADVLWATTTTTTTTTTTKDL